MKSLTNMPFAQLLAGDICMLSENKGRRIYAILSGDYGGQIYATIPLFSNACSESILIRVLKVLDLMAWDDEFGVAIEYVLAKEGEKEHGGMGGGKLTDTVWIHPDFDEAVENVVCGWLRSHWRKNMK